MASFGKLLLRVQDEHRSLVIEKRGTPKAVLLSIRDYVRLAAPEPDVLRVIGEDRDARGRTSLPHGTLTRKSRPRAPKAQARMIPLRLVVVDINIVVSGALKPDGLQRTVFLLAITKPARLYISEAILAEYREVLRAQG